MTRELRAAHAVANRQAGLITSAQARQVGLTRYQITRLVETGVWFPLQRGRYLATGDRLWEARVRAALAGRPDTVACGVTAARLHGLRAVPIADPAEPVYVMTPSSNGRARPGVVVRRSDPGEPAVVRGVAVTSADRTVADLVLAWPRTDAVLLMDDALQQGKVASLDRARWLTAGRRGCVKRQDWWDLADGRAESPLESRFRLLLVDHGIGGYEPQYRVVDPATGQRVRLDFAWPELGVCVEVDGAAVHDTLPAVYVDRDRQNMLVRLGWILLRFTYADVVGRPDHVVTALTAALTPRRHAPPTS